MSHFFPKRISELATTDSDVDTPDKRSDSSFVKNQYRLPKRVADLDIQESDSDDDKDSKLNCAILNDSFILSASMKLEYDDTPAKASRKTDENNQNVNNVDSGFVSSFAAMKTDPEGNKSPTKPEEDPPKLQYRPIKSRTQLFGPKPVLNEVSNDLPAGPSIFKKNFLRAESDSGAISAPMPGPKKIAESRALAAESSKILESSLKTSEATPMKRAEDHLFATPSFRPQSFSVGVNRVSNISQAPKHASERKEKPQAKILFTTPISRPPPGSLLESTPLELRKPQTSNLRKLSPIKEPSAEKEKSNEQIVTVKNVDYIIDKKIGSGGSSSVFLAREKRSAKEFAIKFVKLDGEQQIIDGYLNETKLLARLQGHRSVVSLFDYCHMPSERILYMVMEKGDSDLHKILQGYRTHIPLYTLMLYWHQMLEAVDYIHRNGVIHSDLKPANFLMIEGRLKLIDFGIASNIALDSTSIIKFSQAGTFNYISPEALIDTSNGDSPSTHHQPKIRLSTKSDVWSLGCIFYLLIYKKTPFSHIKVLHQKITALTNPRMVVDYPELPNFYPVMLVEMVKKCLVYNPKERSSVADLLQYPFEMLIPLETDK